MEQRRVRTKKSIIREAIELIRDENRAIQGIVKLAPGYELYFDGDRAELVIQQVTPEGRYLDHFPVRIEPNDVKKGDVIILKDYSEAKVMDNQRGMIRSIEAELMGSSGEKEQGSGYVFEWKYAQIGKYQLHVELTDKQKRQASMIKIQMGRL